MSLGLMCWATLGHFICGIIAALAIFKKNFWPSFLICNGGHFLMEMIELTYHPFKNHKVESGLNHAGDIVAFLIGWCIGFYIPWNPSKLVKGILLTILILVAMAEIGREIIPSYFKEGFPCRATAGCWNDY